MSRAARLAVVAMAALGGRAVAQETVVLGGREVVVWRPADAATGPQPVVIFSHGFGGCATQSTFLTAALAARGYWVVAPNHEDARCGQRGAPSRPEEPFRNPERWSDRTYADRAADIRAVREALADHPDFAGRVDLGRLGLVGHSLGGYTVVGLAGGWLAWRVPGVRAVLALSPYTEPFLAHGTIGGVAAPVMYQGGTLDLGITPSLKRSRGAYDASPAPKYFVEFQGAGHFAWTNLRSGSHKLILDYGIAFLDHYLLGQPAPDLLTRPAAGVAELRYASELGSADVRLQRRTPRRGGPVGGS